MLTICFAFDSSATPIAGHLPGVCASTGGILLPLDDAAFPKPAAHFPLTNQSFTSWPLPTFAASSNGTNWVQDATFGSVIDCSVSI